MKKYICILFLFVCSIPVMAQNTQISGVVKDGKQTIIGATIVEKGTTNGTVTDINGNFKLQMRKLPATLVLSSIGYLTKEVQVTSRSSLTITLDYDAKGLNEVVVVGYQQKKLITNIGAVSQISGNLIAGVPSANVQNLLAGRLTGIAAQQTSGQPGKDAATITIRGVNSLAGNNNPLIIVDDVEFSYAQLTQVDANEIETVSVLKDGSTTAIYGIKGANGVLVITTKRGKIGRPSFNLSTEWGANQIITMPRFLSSYDVATLRNEARANDGLSLEFTQADLDLFKSGTDPYGHPNTNWTADLFNRSAPQSNYNLNISGGTNIVQYFVSLGAYNQRSQLKNIDPENPVDPSYYYNRQTFRTNLDITPNKRLKLSIDVRGSLQTVNEPNGVFASLTNDRNIFNSLYIYASTNPFMLDGKNPNGSWASNGFQNNASLASVYSQGGWWKYYNNDVNVNLKGTHKLDFFTEGLSVSAITAYGSSSSDQRSLIRGALPAYKFDAVTNTYTNTNAVLQVPAYAAAGNNLGLTRTLKLTGIINYNRTFDGHNIGGMVLYNQYSSTDRYLLPVNSTGFSGRFDYDYKQRYIMQFTIARNGTDKYQGSKRFGLFPALVLGWNVAEEQFFQNAIPSIQVLKLRGSYSLTGSDQGSAGGVNGQLYSSGGGYNFGNTSTSVSGILEGALVNTDINWEQERQLDLGVDMTLFKRLKITADYFHRYRYDQVISLASYSLIFGQTLGQYNKGITKDDGFEIELSYQGTIGKVGFSIAPQLTYSKNTQIYSGTVDAYPYLSQNGQPIGLQTGFIAHGFYNQDDIDAINAGTQPKPSVPFKAGYLKYEDLNGDNIIDAKDKALIGRPNYPSLTGGLDLGLNYKNLRLDALLQGAGNYDVRVYGAGGDPFNSNLQPIHMLRWTPATAETARYPILSTKADSYNYSFQNNSTFWTVETRYVRLKQVKLSYAMPIKWIQTVNLKNMTLTASAYNLVTWNNYDQFQQDAEVSSGSNTAFPNTRQFLFGVRVAF